jgi:hypothetical protein
LTTSSGGLKSIRRYTILGLDWHVLELVKMIADWEILSFIVAPNFYYDEGTKTPLDWLRDRIKRIVINQEFWGYCIPSQRLILLWGCLDAQRLLRVLHHELAHALLYEAGVENTVNTTELELMAESLGFCLIGIANNGNLMTLPPPKVEPVKPAKTNSARKVARKKKK